jgi:hypothetical protein
MRISLYSGMSCWIVVPDGAEPDATGLPRPLIFEGTIHSHLLPSEVWARIWSQWQRRAFARLSEDMGLVLLEASLRRYGTLAPPFSGPARERGRQPANRPEPSDRAAYDPT